jgi:SAM-dependent methyltransferase
MRLFPRAVGLDLAPRQSNTVGGDMCAMPFRSEAFDTVFSIEVLEHLSGDRLSRGLHEVRRVLRKGGHAVLVTPYREDLTRRRTVCPHCGTEFHWLGHVRSFDEDSLASILRSAGLEVVMSRALPLALRGNHRLLGRLSFLLALVGSPQPNFLIVVARRPA